MDKEKMNQEQFITEYLKFKESCVIVKIFDIDEIIKLFEVFISQNE